MSASTVLVVGTRVVTGTVTRGTMSMVATAVSATITVETGVFAPIHWVELLST